MLSRKRKTKEMEGEGEEHGALALESIPNIVVMLEDPRTLRKRRELAVMKLVIPAGRA